MTSELDEETATGIRDIMELDDDYVVTDSLEFLHEKRNNMRRGVIDALRGTYHQDIAEKIFDEHMAPAIKCFSQVGAKRPPLTAARFLNMENPRQLRGAHVNAEVQMLEAYFDNVPEEFLEYGPRHEWVQIFAGTLIETPIQVI
jgi:hypothetical protein